MAYYYRKEWHDLPPGTKGAVALDPQPDLPRPPFRPGFWLRFVDPVCVGSAVEMVGKVAYVESTETGRERWYEIVHGSTLHRVPESRVRGRMVDKERV